MSARRFNQEILASDEDASLRASLARIERMLEQLLALARSSQAEHREEADPTDILRAACRDMHIAVSGDGYVREIDAARLLNKSPNTLKNWRDQARPLEFRKFAHRIEYSLETLAAFLSD